MHCVQEARLPVLLMVKTMQKQLGTLHSAVSTKTCKADVESLGIHNQNAACYIALHDKIEVCIRKPSLHNLCL